MKILTTSCLSIAAALAVQSAAADCEMPSLVRSIPDGTTSTEEELLAAQADVKAYIAAMDDYIACTNEELTVEGDDAADEFLFLMSSRITSAEEEIDAVATAFNDQVTAFREAAAAGDATATTRVPGIQSSSFND